MYLTPDLTASDPLYRAVGRKKRIIANSQKIYFDSPVHIDSIEMVLMGTVNQPMIRGVDWDALEEDIDIDSAADMIGDENEMFQKDSLCKQITILKPYIDVDYTVSMDYQMLYPDHGKVSIINDEPLDITVDLIEFMLRQLRYLMNAKDPVLETIAPSKAEPLLLEEDPHMKRPENFIVNEKHEVNVPNGRAFVRLRGGDFSKDSVKIIDENTGDEMVAGHDGDYVVFTHVPHKVEMSSHKGGIFRHILFLKSYVGTVSIDYHAFGGDVTLDDMYNLTDSINNLFRFVTREQLVTFRNLKDAPVMSNLNSKINQVQDEVKDMRALLSGRPTGIDSTHGLTRKKNIKAVDRDLHWWDLAYLYKVDGSDEVVTSDTLHIRFRTLHSAFMFNIIIAFNLHSKGDKISADVLAPVYDKGYVPYEDYSGLNQIIRPQFRCVWNENSAQGSGVTLQVGMALKGMLEDTLVIESLSGNESCWTLFESSQVAEDPKDDVFELPAVDHIWSTENPDSRVESLLIPFKEGHIVWAGSEPINNASGTKQFNLNHLLEDEVDIRKIRSLRVELAEDIPDAEISTDRQSIQSVITFPTGSEDMTGSTSFYYNNRPAYIKARIYRDVEGHTRIELLADISAGVSSNPLNLRHVLINT